jgi:thiol:disulfide interchange protein
MKPKTLRASLLLCLVSFAIGPKGGVAWGAQGAPKAIIYDEAAEGSKQIADALAVAKKEHKQVLLQFGANWCVWCHRLHKLFGSDQGVAAALKRDYVVVLIDVNKGHNKDTDAKYGEPTKLGLPVLVVLDADGKRVTTQETGSLEEGDHHSPEKVMAFLKKWSVSR